MADWLDDHGVVTLPSGTKVRGRPLGGPARPRGDGETPGGGVSSGTIDVSPADFALVLTDGTMPAWTHRRIRWPDFWIPLDRADALDALHEAYDRARDGERVEVACRGGRGRTGTALAALAILDGVPAAEAVGWIRAQYHPNAVETPWQRRWLRGVC